MPFCLPTLHQRCLVSSKIFKPFFCRQVSQIQGERTSLNDFIDSSFSDWILCNVYVNVKIGELYWMWSVIVFMMQTFQTSFHAIQREDLNRFNWMTGGGGRGGAAVWQTCLLSLTTHCCSHCSAPHLHGRVCVRAGNEGSRSFQCLLGPSPFVESAYYLPSSPWL